LLHNIVRGQSLHLHHEADTAGVVFMAWVIKALLGGSKHRAANRAESRLIGRSHLRNPKVKDNLCEAADLKTEIPQHIECGGVSAACHHPEKMSGHCFLTAFLLLF
jgi:hypothetical protein